MAVIMQKYLIPSTCSKHTRRLKNTQNAIGVSMFTLADELVIGIICDEAVKAKPEVIAKEFMAALEELEKKYV